MAIGNLSFYYPTKLTSFCYNEPNSNIFLNISTLLGVTLTGSFNIPSFYLKDNSCLFAWSARVVSHLGRYFYLCYTELFLFVLYLSGWRGYTSIAQEEALMFMDLVGQT